MHAISQLVHVFALFLSLYHGLQTSAGAEVTVGPSQSSQELVWNLFEDVLSVVNWQSDETKTFHGSVSVSTKALLERFFWSGLDEEGLEGGKESHHFPLMYFITNELASDVPNPGWVSSSIRSKMTCIIIPGECTSC